MQNSKGLLKMFAVCAGSFVVLLLGLNFFKGTTISSFLFFIVMIGGHYLLMKNMHGNEHNNETVKPLKNVVSTDEPKKDGKHSCCH